jgi:hypothetical protein
VALEVAALAVLKLAVICRLLQALHIQFKLVGLAPQALQVMELGAKALQAQ